MKLQNATINRKLYVSFAFVLVMMLLVTAFSFFVIGKLEEFRRDVARVMAAQDEIGAKKDLQLQVANVRQLITNASLTKDRKVIEEEATPSFETALKDIGKLMELNRNDTEQTAKLEDLKKDLSGMWDTGNRMFNAYLVKLDNGNSVMNEYNTISTKVLKDTAAIADEQGKNIKKEVKTINQKVGRVLHFITLFIIVCVILGSVFAVFIITLRNSINRDVN